MKQLITIGLGALLSLNELLNNQGKERQISFWQDLQIANLPADQKPVRPILASPEEMMELARLFPKRD